MACASKAAELRICNQVSLTINTEKNTHLLTIRKSEGGGACRGAGSASGSHAPSSRLVFSRFSTVGFPEFQVLSQPSGGAARARLDLLLVFETAPGIAGPLEEPESLFRRCHQGATEPVGRIWTLAADRTPCWSPEVALPWVPASLPFPVRPLRPSRWD